MFIPTNSDDQISINLRKKEIEKKIKKFSSHSHSLPVCSFIWFCLSFFSFSFLMWDPHVPLFHFLVRFSSETIYFVPVSISFILIEYSLHICHFSEFFKNHVFRFHSISVALKFIKYSDCLGIQRNVSRSLDFARRT